jgi:hypothetical protein
MSNRRTTYRKFIEFVKSLYPCEFKGFLCRNMNTLAAMITGIIIGKQSHLPQIAANSRVGLLLPCTTEPLLSHKNIFQFSTR